MAYMCRKNNGRECDCCGECQERYYEEEEVAEDDKCGDYGETHAML